jgi:hypothetical protein
MNKSQSYVSFKEMLLIMHKYFVKRKVSIKSEEVLEGEENV